MKTVNEIMREFYGEYKAAACGKKNFTWKDMVNGEKYLAKHFGYDKVKVARMNAFTGGLKEHFGEEKMKVIVGMIGKLDYCTVTGHLLFNENKIKNMTVKDLKADFDELIEEAKFDI